MEEKEVDEEEWDLRTNSLSASLSVSVLLGIGILAPADEHGDAAAHDVKPGSLLLDEASTSPGEGRPLHGGGSGGRG